MGADVSIVKSGSNFAALHVSAIAGHIGVAEVLLEAGADIEGSPAEGSTPLYLAALGGHWEVMVVLIEAGANVDTRGWDGERSMPLYIAAEKGHVNAVRDLLRVRANPLLGWTDQEPGRTWLPLDTAARWGHLEVVNEMIRQVGIEGCGGASDGVNALANAARHNHVDMLAILTDAGVVDTGEALVLAAGLGSEASVKVLLPQQQQDRSTGGNGCVNATDSFGITPVLGSIMNCPSYAPRVVRLLVDAGADTTSAIPLTPYPGGDVRLNDTPLLNLTIFCLMSKSALGINATEQQLNTLKAIRRLLLQVEAVHAVSWLWHSLAPSQISRAALEGTERATPTTSLTLMMPILKRRTERRRVLLAALYRQSSKL